jgi:hypothetical protein
MTRIDTTITSVNNGQFFDVSYWTPSGMKLASFRDYNQASTFALEHSLTY